MKKIILYLLISFGVNASYAEVPSKKDPVSVCGSVEKLAGVIMENRQSGTSMSHLMKIAKDTKMAEEMIIEAYEQSRFSTESFQKKSIENFKSRWFLKCFKQLKSTTNI